MSISSHSREAFDHVYAWLKKEPWKNRFQNYFDEVLSELAALHEMDMVAYVERARIEGWESQMMSGLLEYFAGLCFEDEPQNVVDDYLKRRGWKETPIGRAYLEEVSTRAFRLYQVQAVVTGASLTIQDVLDPSRIWQVSEVLGSQSAQIGDFLLAKVVHVQDKPYFTGALYKIKPKDAIEWLAELQDILEIEGISATDEEAVDEVYHDLGIDLLGDAFAYFINPLPTITNTDGHLYLYSEIRFGTVAKFKNPKKSKSKIMKYSILAQSEIVSF